MFNNLRSTNLVKLRQFSNLPLGPSEGTIQFTKCVETQACTALPNLTAILCGKLRSERLPNLGNISCGPSNSPFINNMDIFNEKHSPFIPPLKHDNYVYVFKNMNEVHFGRKCDRPPPRPKRRCKKDNIVKTYGDDCPKCTPKSKPICDRCGPRKRNPCH